MDAKYNPESPADRKNLAVVLDSKLSRAGFKLVETRGFAEDIYELPVNERIRIVVFSTIENGVCRGNGKDAIRVVALYKRKDGKDQFLLSETRVNRTGAILDIGNRTMERARDVYRELVHRKNQRMVCRDCGAPLFTSKNKNEVCAETCWIK